MPNAARFNRKDVDLVFAHFKMFEDLWDEARLGKRWISLANKSAKEMTEVIIDAVRDQETSKNLVVMCYQKFIGGSNLDVLKGYLNEIKEEVEAQRVNKLSFSTAYFVPNHATVWNQVADFNKYVHELNDAMGVTRVNIHRAIMAQLSDTNKSLRVKASMWSENQLGVYIGCTPSYEACRNIAKTLITVFDKAFCEHNIVNNPRSKEPRLLVPLCLSVTPGFCDIPFMRQVMQDKLIIKSKKKTPKEARMKCSEQRTPGWQNWKIYQHHGPMRRFDEREGALAAHKEWLKRSDPVPVWGNEWSEDQEMVIVRPSEGGYVVQQEDQQDRQREDHQDDHQDEYQDDNEPQPIADKEYEPQPTNDDNSQKENQEGNCNEDQLIIAVEKIETLERQVEICQERIKAYEQKAENKEAQVYKEKAATKWWRNQAEMKTHEKNKAEEQARALEVKLNTLANDHARLMTDYEFLRTLYESERRPDRIHVTRHFEESGDNDDPVEKEF